MSNNLPFYATLAAAYLYSQANLEKTVSYKKPEPVIKMRDVGQDKEVYNKAQMAAKYATLTKPRRILEWDNYGR